MRYRIPFLTIILIFSCALGRQSRSPDDDSNASDTKDTVVIGEYSLTGIYGDPYSIFLSHDVPYSKLIVSTPQDTLEILGVRDVDSVAVQAQRFLEIMLRIPGGTGVSLRRKVIVCIMGGKIITALDIKSDYVSRFSETFDLHIDSLHLFDEKDDYHVSIAISRVDGGQYEATIHESEHNESKYDPSTNLSYEQSTTLAFDTSRCIFYNKIVKLNDLYQIESNHYDTTVEKYLYEEVPCAKLRAYSYYFIDMNWYISNEEKYLYQW